MHETRHAFAIAGLASARLARVPPKTRRRRVRELRAVVSLIDEGRLGEAEAAAEAYELAALLEDARSDHLARLDADDGLRALVIPWHRLAATLGRTV